MHCGVSWVSMKFNLLRDTQSDESLGGKDCDTETEDCVTAGTEETKGREPRLKSVLQKLK